MDTSTHINSDGYILLEAYKDAGFKDHVSYSKGGDLSMELLFKQDTLNFTRKVVFDESQGQGNNSANLKFNRVEPEKVSFEFLIDRTGVIPGHEYSDNGIKEDLKKFEEIINYNGEIHRPNYLQLTWNKKVFKGNIVDVEISYKLFGKDGIPLRAIIKATFLASIEDQEAEKIKGDTSPDLTHSRIVKNGDTLPLMTYRIYGDSKYYLEVAKANNLNNFRNLEVGSTIYFPAFDK